MDKYNNTINVLLVEDNKFDREIFKKAFEDAELACKITECTDAETALELLRGESQSFDVAVIDQTLPGMTGLDLCKTIHNKNLELPLVLLTGTGSEKVALEALETGVDDYIIKGSNVHCDILPLTIRKVVEKHVEKLDREKVKQELVEANNALIESQNASQSIMEALRAEIEERKKVETQLRKLSVAVEQNPATIVITDTDGNIEYVNPHFTISTGYTAEEAIGQNPRILKSGEQSDAFYKELWVTITAGKTWEGDFHNKRKNGELYWESASISPIKDDNGDVNHFVAIKTDVTARRAQEEEIRRQHLEQETLNYILALSFEDMTFNELLEKCLDEILSIPFKGFKSIGSIFAVESGSENLTLVVNKGMDDALLKECEKGIPLGRCLCGRAAKSGKTEFAACVDDRHDITSEEMPPHGHYCVPIKAQKEVLGVINLYLEEGCSRNENDVAFLENVAATIAGIIQRKHVEDKLKESEKKYRDIINTTREGYWLLDREIKILDVNESLCIMLGYLPEEMCGKGPVDFVDEENAKIFREQTSKISLTSHRVYEISLKRKDGENVPAIVHATTIRDSSGGASGAFAFVTDISDLKETEVSLRLAKEEAEGATKLKDKFVSLVSHDLKNPIHRIMMYFELLQSTEQVSDSGKEMIEEGIEACDEMSVLINDVLSLSRIKGSSIKPEYAFILVHDIAGQAINNYHRIAVDKGIELINEIPGKARIYADERLLLEVLRNLISNAVKFCKKGDKVRLYIPDGEPATIAVADTGIGIKDTNMFTLFSYEEKTSTRGTSGERGTGFGLPLCHEIVAAHRGTLELESEVDKGSTFYIRLPDVKPTVFIVDDDESIRALFRKRLEKLDIVIMEADSGETAIELIKDTRPQLFFVDLHMPGMGGVELLRQIKREPETEKIPVVVVTADKTMEVVDQAFMEGADDFIVKPFEKGELIESVERFVH